MGFKQEAEVPKGRIVPMYLTDEGDLYPIFFTSEEQMELVSTVISTPSSPLPSFTVTLTFAIARVNCNSAVL